MHVYAEGVDIPNIFKLVSSEPSTKFLQSLPVHGITVGPCHLKEDVMDDSSMLLCGGDDLWEDTTVQDELNELLNRRRHDGDDDLPAWWAAGCDAAPVFEENFPSLLQGWAQDKVVIQVTNSRVLWV